MLGGAEDRAEDVAADRVHGPRPAPGEERPAAAVVHGVPMNHLPGPERLEVLVGLWLARHGDHVVAELGQDGDGDAPHAAAGAGDDDLAASGSTPCFCRASTHSPAVNPAVPSIMVSRRLRPCGSGTTHSAGTRTYSAEPPQRLAPTSNPVTNTGSPGTNS